MPETGYHEQKENPIEKLFWGRIKLERAFAYLFFRKSGIVQNILHELKYNSNQELARFLGIKYAQRIKSTVADISIDSVAAIPLHKSKKRIRGYNQSELFAEGLAEGLGIEDLSSSLKRNIATETQTKKSRIERWQNVENVFELIRPEQFKNRHILIVDDVITTGATIESCVHAVEIQGELNKISVASIACVN